MRPYIRENESVCFMRLVHPGSCRIHSGWIRHELTLSENDPALVSGSYGYGVWSAERAHGSAEPDRIQQIRPRRPLLIPLSCTVFIGCLPHCSGAVAEAIWTRGYFAWGVSRRRPRTSPAELALLYSAPQSIVPGRRPPGIASRSAGTARCPCLARQTWPSWHFWPPQTPATTSCLRNAPRLAHQMILAFSLHLHAHKQFYMVRACMRDRLLNLTLANLARDGTQHRDQSARTRRKSRQKARPHVRSLIH